MEVSEAKGKLHHYVNIYGPGILKLTPQQAMERSREYQGEAETDPRPGLALKLAGKAVQYAAIAECLKVCGDDLPKPSNVVDFQARRPSSEGAIQFTDEELNESPALTYVSHEALMRSPLVPKFKIGELVWIEAVIGDFADDDPNAPVGFLDGVIAGISWSHNAIGYHIGFTVEDSEGSKGDMLVVDEENFVDEDQIHRDIPDEHKPKIQRPRPALSLVKN